MVQLPARAPLPRRQGIARMNENFMNSAELDAFSYLVMTVVSLGQARL
jgi:hypothetical protein